MKVGLLLGILLWAAIIIASKAVAFVLFVVLIAILSVLFLIGKFKKGSEQGTFKSVCCVCGVTLKEYQYEGPDMTSHGLCAKCADKAQQDL